MACLEDAEVAEEHVAAVLEGDGLVADSSLLGNVDGIVAARCAVAAEAKPFPIDESGAGVMETSCRFSPQMSELCQWLCP